MMSLKTLALKPQSGISMFEFLVALFVFSIGLVGFAAIQNRALQDSFDTTQRSQVIWRAQEFADRIRANPNAVADYETAIADLDNNLCDGGTEEAPTPPPRGGNPLWCSDYYNTSGEDGTKANAATDCSAAEVARFDTWNLFCAAENTVSLNLGILDTTEQFQLECFDTADNPVAPCDANSNVVLTTRWISNAALKNNQFFTGSGGEPDLTDEDFVDNVLTQNYVLEFQL